jgi:hypothetical protein
VRSGLPNTYANLHSFPRIRESSEKTLGPRIRGDERRGAHRRAFIGGDVLTHVAISFACPEWRIGGDFDRDRAVLTRKALLDQLAGDNPPRPGFTWPGLGVVERTGNAYRFIPL